MKQRKKKRIRIVQLAATIGKLKFTEIGYFANRPMLRDKLLLPMEIGRIDAFRIINSSGEQWNCY